MRPVADADRQESWVPSQPQGAAILKPPPHLVLSAVTDRSKLDGIAAEWRELHRANETARYSLAPYWCRRMWERQAAVAAHRPVVIVGRAGDRIRLLWPLVCVRRRLWRVVRGLSANLVDYDDMLVAEDPGADQWRREAWTFAIATLKPDLMLFRRIAEGSGLDRLITGDMLVSQRSSVSLCVDLRNRSDWNGYLQSLGKSARKSLRYGRNWLARFGPVRYEAVTDESTGLALIAWMLERKHRRLGRQANNRREKTEHAVFGQDLPFLLDVTGHAFRSGELRVMRLSAGDRTVAVDTMFVRGKRAVSWLHAYDDDFTQASPGNYACTESMAWAHRHGIEAFDLMPEPEPYKYMWTDQGYTVRDVRVAITRWGKVLVTWHRSSLRNLALGLYMRAPRPVQLMARRLLR